MIFSTITQNGVTLSVDSYNLPTQNSNNIQLKFVQDTENFSGYTPTVAMALLDTALVSCAEILNEGGFVPIQSDGTFLVQNNILSQDGFLAVAINLTQASGNTTENVMLGPVVYKIQANVSALSPLPSDDSLWQSIVSQFTETYLSNYTTNTVQPVLEQAQQAVATANQASSNANQASQNANEASENVQTAYNNLGNYKVENGILYFMKADGTYNQQGITLAGQSTILDGQNNPILNGSMTPQDNVLTNGDFRYGGINQKGQSTYNTTNQYGADMWELLSGSMTINADNMTVNGEIVQPLYNLNGQYTFAINVLSGSGSIKFDGVTNTLSLQTGLNVLTVNGAPTWFHIIGTNLVWNYAKGELGSKYTGIKEWNASSELQKCLYSYEKKSIVGLAVSGTFQQFFQLTQANYYFSMEGFVTKSKNPTITVLSISSNEGPVSSLTATAQGITNNSLSALVTNNQCDRPYLIFELAIDAYDYYLN